MPIEKKRCLLYLHIIPITCWALDVLSTLYVIDYLGVAEELNPLGWPFGVWGALIFYVPALVFTYLLLFRIQHKYSAWVATLIYIISLGFGVTNLRAALHNISIASLYVQ